MRLVRLLIVILSFSVCVLAAESPFTGTWKYNASKSHSIPPGIKSSTAQVDADQGNLKLHQDFVDDKDQSATVTFEAKFDGKEYPVHGDPDTDTVSVHRVNEHQLDLTFTKAGKVIGKNSVVVSKDGKTTSCHLTVYGEGKPKKGTDVYDKQLVSQSGKMGR